LAALLLELGGRVSRRGTAAEAVADKVGVDEERHEERDGDGRGACNKAAEITERDVRIGETEVQGAEEEVAVRKGFL